MPLPSGYTDATFAAFVRDDVLGGTAVDLGWTDPAVKPYPSIIAETLFAYGVATMPEATDVPKLRAIGRREAWRAAMQETANRMDVAIPGAPSIQASQAHKQAVEQFRIASEEARPYLAASTSATAAPAGSYALAARPVW